MEFRSPAESGFARLAYFASHQPLPWFSLERYVLYCTECIHATATYDYGKQDSSNRIPIIDSLYEERHHQSLLSPNMSSTCISNSNVLHRHLTVVNNSP